MDGSGLSFLANWEEGLLWNRIPEKHKNQMHCVDPESNKPIVKREHLETIGEFLQRLGIWWYQEITINFVTCHNGILVMYEYIHFLETFPEVYKGEMTLFALNLNRKQERGHGIHESSMA